MIFIMMPFVCVSNVKLLNLDVVRTIVLVVNTKIGAKA